MDVRIADCGLTTSCRLRLSRAAACSLGLLHQVSHLRMRRLHVDGQIRCAEHFAGGRTDRGDDQIARSLRGVRRRVPRSSASLSKLSTCWPEVNMTTSISPATMRRIFCFERADVLGHIPIVDVHALDHGPAGFEAGDQAGVGHAVFLQADDEIRHGQPLVERR